MHKTEILYRSIQTLQSFKKYLLISRRKHFMRFIGTEEIFQWFQYQNDSISAHSSWVAFSVFVLSFAKTFRFFQRNGKLGFVWQTLNIEVMTTEMDEFKPWYGSFCGQRLWVQWMKLFTQKNICGTFSAKLRQDKRQREKPNVVAH